MLSLWNWLTRLTAWRKKHPVAGQRCLLQIETLEDRKLPSATGTGLLGQYYSDQTLTNLVTSKVDPSIHFNWDNQSPARGVAATNFSVRWTGQIQAPYTGAMVIYTKSEGGFRLYINGDLVINDWTDDRPHVENNDALVHFVAGQKYNIEIDFHQSTGPAVMQLYWGYPKVPWQGIPTSNLYPAQPPSSPLKTPKLGSVPVTVSDWFSQNLHDPGIISLARQLDADGTLSRNDMLALFQEVEAQGAVTSTELTDLQTIVNNPTLLGIPGYVENLADKVVYGDPANADYLGKPLGNLAVGSSAIKLQDLVGKWFLGTDLPEVNTTGLTYQYAVGSLFGSAGPLDTDVKQGEVNDCYFVAALAETADSSPQLIRDAFLDNGDGTFTVRFLNNGVPDYVTVNRYLPTTGAGTLWYAGMGWSITNTANVLWVPLLEKAYAELAEEGWSRPTAANSYAAIGDGWEGTVLMQLTGKSGTFAPITSSSTTLNSIISTFQIGKMVCLDSDSTTIPSVVSNHIYAMLGYNASTQTFTLFNPWGSQIQLSWSQIAANFDSFTYLQALSPRS